MGRPRALMVTNAAAKNPGEGQAGQHEGEDAQVRKGQRHDAGDHRGHDEGVTLARNPVAGPGLGRPAASMVSAPHG